MLRLDILHGKEVINKNQFRSKQVHLNTSKVLTICFNFKLTSIPVIFFSLHRCITLSTTFCWLENMGVQVFLWRAALMWHDPVSKNKWSSCTDPVQEAESLLMSSTFFFLLLLSWATLSHFRKWSEVRYRRRPAVTCTVAHDNSQWEIICAGWWRNKDSPVFLPLSPGRESPPVTFKPPSLQVVVFF